MTMSIKLSENDTSRFHTKVKSMLNKTSDKAILKFTANTWLNNNLEVNIRTEVLSSNPRNNDDNSWYIDIYAKLPKKPIIGELLIDKNLNVKSHTSIKIIIRNLTKYQKETKKTDLKNNFQQKNIILPLQMEL